jgi:lipopolysaccharide transport system ATP-binding protein
MTKPVISVRGLGKKYKLGATISHNTLRDHIAHGVKSFWNKIRGNESFNTIPSSYNVDQTITHNNPSSSQSNQTFWALKDVNFDVQQGEVIGIIGRNGAGKTTLLKILSQITEPTEGEVRIRGRVSSLLEVGTGFHQELSGRENIYLNGAILGMTKAEIRQKFDEIVEFAEIEKFIGTPVKRYSSGMYVRLAFAVAAHLEPEILLVDEVLAVGDAEFQKKCLSKMRHAAIEGRTVLFVSHNMDAVRRLCLKTIWLDNGCIRKIGGTVNIISNYILQNIKTGGVAKFSPPHQLANGMPVLLHTVQVLNDTGKVTTHFSARTSIMIQIEWENYKSIYKPRIGFVLQTHDGFDVLTAMDANSWDVGELSPGRRISTCVIPGGILNEGEYLIDIGGDCPKGGKKNRGLGFNKSRTDAVLRFEVEDDMTLPNKYYGQEGFRDAKWAGVFLLDIPWQQTCLTDHKAIIAENKISQS